MLVTRVRTLPIRVDPVAGEALDSWLAAIAYRTQTCWADMLAAVLPSRSGASTGRALQRSCTVYLRPEESAEVATATGLEVALINAMTLSRYDGIVVTIDQSRRRATRAFPWGRARHFRYCPRCLAETAGRWQLHWSLGWVFACTVHRCLLVDTCPSCTQTQKFTRYPGEAIPQPARCSAVVPRHNGKDAVQCPADLTTADVNPLPVDHPAVLTQQLILDIISANRATFGVYAREPVVARDALADIRAIASRVLAYATRADIAERIPADLNSAYQHVLSSDNNPQPSKKPTSTPGRAAPIDAVTAAVGITIALSILGSPDVATAGASMRWIVYRGRGNGVAVNTTTIPEWGRGATAALAAVQLSALAPLMKFTDQLRYRVATIHPSHPAKGDSNAERLTRQLPAMLWPAWSLRFSVSPCSQLQMRPALSAALLLVGTRLNVTEAARRTGSAVSAGGVSRTLHFLGNHALWSDVLIALARLSDFLSANTVPIDYARRRQLDYRGLLPSGLWAQICQATATTPGAGLKADVVRTVLFERLSGLPASRSPFAAGNFEFRSKVAAFPRLLTPELATHLDQACRQFLDELDLASEPLTWHPPLDLLGGLELPGADPSTVPTAELHRLVREENLALTDVAEKLDTTIEVVRHALELNPAPMHLTPAQRGLRGTPFAAVQIQLPKATLADLYQHQRLTLRQIADRVGSNEKSIARLTRMYDIPLRTYETPIDPEWLYSQYVIHGRTLTDIGREVGLSVSQTGRRAKALGITTRPAVSRPAANSLA